MRRFLTVIAIAGLAACQGDTVLAPVQTVDGDWRGTQNGFALTLLMAQSDTVVTGSSVFGSTGGAVQGTCAGTFKYPNLHVVITVAGFQPVNYDAVMSQAEAKLVGKLNGSGLSNVEMDITKR